MAQTAAAYFRDRASADTAYDELVQRGFSRDDISVVGRGTEGGAEGGKHRLADDHDVSAGEGATVGGLTGLLIGVAAMLIPGIGPIIGAGPVIAALTGAMTGGLVGALVHSGVDEDAARYYDQRFREGTGVLLTVRAEGARYADARDILSRHGGDTRSPDAGGQSAVAQSAGASPGATGAPDPLPRVGDDPGLVGTPGTTTTGPIGTQGTTFDPDVDPNRSTTPTTDVRRQGDPPHVHGPGGPPLI